MRPAVEIRSPVRAVIFDLDGTLVDSAETYYQADRELWRRHGADYTRQQAAHDFGQGTMELLALHSRRFGVTDPIDALFAEKDEIYLGLLREVPVFPTVRRFWDLLAGRGVPLAIASGSSVAVLARVVPAVGLAGDARAVVSAEEVPRGKPWPDVFVEAARRLDVPPSACVVVEDSQHGVLAARNAGMRCIAVAPAGDALPQDFQHADLLFRGGLERFDPEAAWAWTEERLALHLV